MRPLLFLVLLFSGFVHAEPQWGAAPCEAYSQILDAAETGNQDLELAVIVMKGRDCAEGMDDEQCLKHMKKLYHDNCLVNQGVAGASSSAR